MKKRISMVFVCLFSLFIINVYPVNAQESFYEEAYESRNEFTFDEMVDRISKEDGLSKQEIIKKLISSEKQSLKNKNNSPQLNDNDILNSLRAAVYRTLTIPIPSVASYKPNGIEFYHKSADFEGSQMTCTQIIWISLDRLDNRTGITKQFSGSIHLQLLDAQTIDWMINGDFFDNGTTSVGGTVTGGIGDYASVTLSVSYSSNHFAYYNQSGRYYMPNR
ncbi:hypothetical protein AAK899_12190 [Erysipelotrichaceae bacterium 51-3]